MKASLCLLIALAIFAQASNDVEDRHGRWWPRRRYRQTDTCSETLTLAAGEDIAIQSTGLPRSYGPRNVCTKTINVAADVPNVELTCDELTMRSWREYLSVSEDLEGTQETFSRSSPFENWLFVPSESSEFTVSIQFRLIHFLKYRGRFSCTLTAGERDANGGGDDPIGVPPNNGTVIGDEVAIGNGPQSRSLWIN
mmetsp:Transcript_55061/g.89666  ORF Transcript_55061/g.89666 Transcript_55061/m.89666 type:complete len:196 (-) Transcript_55061:98-685(-)